jgi:WD40 repeat protein
MRHHPTTNTGCDLIEWLTCLVITSQSNFQVVVPKRRKVTLRAHIGHASCLNYDHGGNWLATSGADSLVRVWDARNCKLLYLLCNYSFVG